MPDDGFARELDTIDAELGDRVTLNNSARHELVRVRRQITELQHQELGLISAVDTRSREIDRLLDERLHATLAEQLVSS